MGQNYFPIPLNSTARRAEHVSPRREPWVQVQREGALEGAAESATTRLRPRGATSLFLLRSHGLRHGLTSFALAELCAPQFATAALLLSLALLLTSCGSQERHPATEAAAPPVAVQTAPVASQEWPSDYEATGTVRARTTATISAKVMGYVQQVSVQVGDRVRQGQALVTLDARDLDAGVRRAEAGRDAVRSGIPEADNGLAAAKANLDLAHSTFKRMEELAAKKSISNQEFDEASAKLKAAQANYEMARSRRAQLDSRMAQADEEVRTAGITRDYAKIVAPFAGVVTGKSVDPGNLAAPGAPLLTIEQEDPTVSKRRSKNPGWHL